jgi:hypothetical protein
MYRTYRYSKLQCLLDCRNNTNLFHLLLIFLLNVSLENISSSHAWQNAAKRCDRTMQNGSVHRRDLLSNIGATVTFGLSAPYYVNAFPSETLQQSAGEAIRRSAATIPGYGPTDIFFPLSWQGTWTLNRENILTSDDTSFPQTVSYNVRFIQSVDDGAVIADRSFNELNYWESSLGSNTTTKIVQLIEWTERNPNDLKLLFANGLHRDVKVTKRASELTNTTVSSSEFQRILEYKSNVNGDTVPKISGRRTLTKWKMISMNHIEGIEIVYDMDMEGGADRIDLASFTSKESRQPKLVSKSRFYLDRSSEY